MKADVKINDVNETWVTVEGDVLNARTADLLLDSAARRNGGGRLRRALVHDQSDGLTINYNSDYPNGVTINSVAYISPKKAERETTEIGRQLGLGGISELVIDGGVQFLWDHGQPLLTLNGGSVETVSLQKLIEDLQKQVADLSDRLAAVEAR